MSRQLYLNFIKDNRWKYIVNGLGTTLQITFFAVILGIALGFLIAVIRSTYDKTGKGKILNFLAKVYLTVIRGTPVLVQLLIIYFVVFASVDINKIIVAVMAFGINSGAYVAEIIRSGIMSIDDGQFEAGRSLGFNYTQTMIYIILPQALKNVLPALANEFIVLLKETSVSGYIAIQDLTKGGDIIRSQTYNALFPLLMVAAIYLIMVLFFEKSKRNIAIDRAAEMIKKLDKNIQKTAVVVSPDINQIKAITDVGFDYIQIHKDMPDDILEKITIPVIRAVNMPDEINGAETESNFNDEIEKLIKNDKIYGILFDAGVPGSGKTFRWHRINGIKEKIKYSGKKFFLAGGLNPDNVKEAVLQVNPDVVDVSSGVEKDTGAGKDREKTEKFIKNIRKEQEKNYG